MAPAPAAVDEFPDDRLCDVLFVSRPGAAEITAYLLDVQSLKQAGLIEDHALSTLRRKVNAFSRDGAAMRTHCLGGLSAERLAERCPWLAWRLCRAASGRLLVRRAEILHRVDMAVGKDSGFQLASLPKVATPRIWSVLLAQVDAPGRGPEDLEERLHRQIAWLQHVLTQHALGHGLHTERAGIVEAVHQILAELEVPSDDVVASEVLCLAEFLAKKMNLQQMQNLQAGPLDEAGRLLGRLWQLVEARTWQRRVPPLTHSSELERKDWLLAALQLRHEDLLCTDVAGCADKPLTRISDNKARAPIAERRDASSPGLAAGSQSQVCRQQESSTDDAVEEEDTEKRAKAWLRSRGLTPEQNTRGLGEESVERFRKDDAGGRPEKSLLGSGREPSGLPRSSHAAYNMLRPPSSWRQQGSERRGGPASCGEKKSPVKGSTPLKRSGYAAGAPVTAPSAHTRLGKAVSSSAPATPTAAATREHRVGLNGSRGASLPASPNANAGYLAALRSSPSMRKQYSSPHLKSLGSGSKSRSPLGGQDVASLGVLVDIAPDTPSPCQIDLSFLEAEAQAWSEGLLDTPSSPPRPCPWPTGGTARTMPGHAATGGA
eukprot:TRINITY_DN74621_c0_g1_i1.p1 TRINITY_DN74621_c0_g1~~TRINITY_DN74621_c0_g1_i1.p1  ORF type:complete len:603 (-),score=88.61 TRINITY_DN74621_c0_g1_i1:664-2472(-)